MPDLQCPTERIRSHARARNGIPAYRPNIYTTDAIVDPYPHYTAAARARARGVAVRGTASTRCPGSPNARRSCATTRPSSRASGVALNPLTNRLSRGTTLTSDGAEHDQRRKLVAHRLLPRALRGINDDVDEQAARVVDRRTRTWRRSTASTIWRARCRMAVVPDLVGWPRDQRDHLLRLGRSHFRRPRSAESAGLKSTAATLRMLRFARRVVRDRSLIEGSMAHEVLLAADAGKLSHAECAPLMIDYIAPSLDTTISAISNALYLFATHPEQWQLLKDDPSLIPNAVNEVIRYESPLRAFSRRHASDTEIAGAPRSRAGARVLVIYASANRDEREWDTRTPSTSAATPPVSSDSATARTPAPDRVWRGWRPRPCCGALVERVDRIELTANRRGRSTTSSADTSGYR